MNKLQRIFLIVTAFIGLTILSACVPVGSNNSADAISAAGVVEAVEVMVAPELGGRVVEVFAGEGEPVKAGDPLFRIESKELAVQREQAEAALEAAEAGLQAARAQVEAANAAVALADAGVSAAEANVVVAETAVDAANATLESAKVALEMAEVQYQIAVSAARLEEKPLRETTWAQTLSNEFSTPPWYFQREEALTAAQTEVDAALASWEAEQANFEMVMAEDRFAEFRAAEERLAEAQAAFLVAADLRDRAIARAGKAPIDDYVQSVYDAALAELKAAQLNYDQLLTSNAASEVLEARARVAAARERYEIALDWVAFLQTGEESLAVQAAGVAVRQAETAVAQAEAQVAQAGAMVEAAQVGVRAAEAERDQALAAAAQAETAVSQAEKMVQQAQAALNLVNIQMEKQLVVAAVSGVITTRSVEPGEIVMPGISVMSIGQLDTLKVTVYIPENKYGQIHLGDLATLTADSFPDRTFNTVVTRISDRAEFTPRNVQTKEERQTTVYAVELSVQDDSSGLKSGMPVDVVFDQ
ncbi:MAG: hypothetical protein Kow0080_32950 [Candidatus Promineifilaceae bacterium]